MLKKMILSMALLTALVMCGNSSVFATSNNNLNFVSIEEINRITDKSEIGKIESELSSEIPEGYHLVEVIESKISYPFIEPKNLSIDLNSLDSMDKLLFDIWTVENIRKDSYDIYFPNNPLNSSWFDGPMSETITFTQTISAHFTSNTGINVGIVGAEIGFDSSYTATVSQSYTVSCGENEMVNVKVFGNFAQWRYDAYKNGQYMGEEFAHKPIGLIFKQYRYGK